MPMSVPEALYEISFAQGNPAGINITENEDLQQAKRALCSEALSPAPRSKHTFCQPHCEAGANKAPINYGAVVSGSHQANLSKQASLRGNRRNFHRKHRDTVPDVVQPLPQTAPRVHGDASLKQGVVDVGDKRADVHQIELLPALTSASLHV